MRVGKATGLQVAFVALVVMLSAVPLSQAVIRAAALDGALVTLVEKGSHFFLATALILSIAPLRRAVGDMLKVRIPSSSRTEVAAVGLLQITAGFGGMAALALWSVAQEGAAWAAEVTRDPDPLVANAWLPQGLVILLLSSTIGPVIEEIVFRGFIYRAFERQWGWLPSLVATSAIFGLYHHHFWSAFTSSVILVCLLRRSGSLRAPILVHMLGNFLLWPPFLGQYVLPRPEALADPWSWVIHGTCLAVAVIAVPAYLYMSRDPPVASTIFLDPDAALPK